MSCCERCPSYDGPARGAGDIVSMLTKASGIEKIVHAVAGNDCGCDKRRQAWNRMIPFKAQDSEG